MSSATRDETAGHHLPAVADPRQEQPQYIRPRLKPAISPNRRRRECHRLLRDEVDAAPADGSLLEAVASYLGTTSARRLGKGRGDHDVIEPLEDFVRRGGSPSHQVATFGIASSRPSKRAPAPA